VSVDPLEARVARLEAERGVIRTLHSYGHAIDYGDEEGWVDCFTEDGVFDVRGRLGEKQLYRVAGRDALRAFVAEHTRAPELWHKHVVVNEVIDVEGDTATCASYFAVPVAQDGAPPLNYVGRYLDRLVREPDGRWRFAERVVHLELRGSGPQLSGGRAAARGESAADPGSPR
jgi:ketosteroid isomerase-like protein